MANRFTPIHTDPLSTQIDIDSVISGFKSAQIDFNAGILDQETRERNFSNAKNTDTYAPVLVETPVNAEDFYKDDSSANA